MHGTMNLTNFRSSNFKQIKNIQGIILQLHFRVSD